MATAVRRPLEEYLALPYRIALTQSTEGGGEGEWLAQVEELPGCAARGDTPEKAARAIRGAMRTWIEQALAEGREIPEPRASSPSGRLLLRMPQSLHAELARRADLEGVSLNQLIVGTLAGALGWRRDGATPEPARAVEPQSAAPEDRAEPPRPRTTPLLSIALVVNLVVVAVAGVAAIALLIVALR